MSRFTLVLLAFAGVAQAKEVWLSASGSVEIGFRGFGPPAVSFFPGQQFNLLAKLGEPDRIVIDTSDDPINNAFFWDSGKNLDIAVDLGTFKLVSAAETTLELFTSNVGPPIGGGSELTYGFAVQFQNLFPVITIPSSIPIYGTQIPNGYLSLIFFTNDFSETDFPLGSFVGEGTIAGETFIAGRAPWEGENSLSQPTFGISQLTTVNFANVPEASSVVLVGMVLLAMATRALLIARSN